MSRLMKYKWWLLGLFLFLPCCVLTGWGLRTPPETYLAEATFPDGVHRLRLLRAEMGPLKYHWKNPWNGPVTKHLREILPRGPRKGPWGDILLRFPDEAPTLVFGTVDQQGRFLENGLGHLDIQFIDSDRFAFSDHSWRGGSNVFGVLPTAFPRRDQDLKIRIRHEKTPASPFEMVIPNPFYQENIKEWTPRPFWEPQTQGPLTVRLTGLSVDPHGSTMNSFAINRLIVDVNTSSPLPEWEDAIVSSSIEDATGNRGTWLSPFEPAWKVVALVYRNPNAKHPPEMVTDLGTIKIPPPGELQMLDKSVTVNGYKLKLRCICGGGAFTRVNEKFSGHALADNSPSGTLSNSSDVGGVSRFNITCGGPFLWVDHDAFPASNDQRLIFRKDSVEQLHLGPWKSKDEIISLDLKPGQTEVTLELIDSRPERFEFIIAPPEAVKAEMLEKLTEPPTPSPPDQQPRLERRG